MSKKFLIVTGNYKENVGGSIVPHRLCQYINEHTNYECFLYRAYIYPDFRDGLIIKSLILLFTTLLKRFFLKIKTIDNNKGFVLYKKPKDLDNYIVVYLEGMRDNPLNAKNVVRLLLHNPGFFTGKVHYSTGELYFLYGPHFSEFKLHGSLTSNKYIDIKYYPIDIYNLDNSTPDNERNGVCYAVRKGIIKDIPNNLNISINEAELIDHLDHKEISKLFKSKKYFISFDTATAYSRLAAVCGCISIVIPDNGVSKESWQPDEKLRYGVAYGISDTEIEWAVNSQEKLREFIKEQDSKNIEVVSDFVYESEGYFNN